MKIFYLLFRRLNIWHYTSTKYLENVIIFEITYFLFISFLAKRNEPKTRSAAKSHEVQGRPGVIVLRSHGAISREFQTHTHPPPYEIPFREMPCSTGDSSGGNALTKCPARRQLRTPGNATRRKASFAFQWADASGRKKHFVGRKAFSFFHIFLLALKEKYGCVEWRKTLYTWDFHLLKHIKMHPIKLP